MARVVHDWWYNVDSKEQGIKASELEFRRSPGSGGWDKKKAGGDIIAPVDFPYSVEMKNQECWSFDKMFNIHTKTHKLCNSPMEDYWEQCVGDANHMNKKPMLVFTRNRYPEFVCIYTTDYRANYKGKIRPLFHHNGRTYFHVVTFFDPSTRKYVK